MMQWVSTRSAVVRAVTGIAAAAVALGGLGVSAASASSLPGEREAVQSVREGVRPGLGTAPHGGSTYLATVGPWAVTMSRVRNMSVEQIPGAWLLGRVTFHTNDRYYSCLDGEALDAWRIPSEPNVVVVHNGDQGAQCVYGTFVYEPFYMGTFDGSLVVFSWHANVSVESLPDASQAGQLGNFQTDNPYYACLDGSSTTSGATVDVWTAPKEFGSSDVAHNGDQGAQCVYGTFSFSTK